ncbi:MAG: sulfatase-like hydrolase/transferase [Chitinivibrionales bacterium]|nr:sulfatase-like hydrolase/transferase [Chitinivibrionales bacterium]
MRIIYFDMDCTRPDHLGVYGYPRPTSPVLDELAKTSVVFDNCFASDTPCLPSRAALFSCRPGIANGVVSHEWPGCNFRFPARPGMAQYYPEYEMPMRLLQRHGYHTITFSVFAQRHLAWWFNAGFSEVSNPSAPHGHENSQTINPRVVDWLRHNVKRTENLFMHINYWDAHTTYRPDRGCRDRVAASPAPPFPDAALIRNHFENVYGPKTARDIMIRMGGEYRSPTEYMPDEIRDRDTYTHMLDSYDGCIATVDKAIGEIVDVLREQGVYDDTAIIVSADHGEAIAQMGMYFEHGVAVDGVAHVPLIVRWPGVTDHGGRCDAMVYQYDFMATIMEMLGIERPGCWDARSLAPALRGDTCDGYPYVVYGCGIFSLQRAVRTREYAYVKTFNSGCLPLDNTYLFDIRHDPEQTLDIKHDNRSVVAEMERLYAEWWGRWCTGPDAVIDPMHLQTPGFAYFPPEEMLARLEYCGRPDQIADLKRRLQHDRRNIPLSLLSMSNY